MVAPLLRVAVCSPRTAGWNQPERLARWQELGFHHAPDFERAQAQHGSLHGELSAAGAEVIDIILSEITTPATTEAGDMIWLDPNTLLIGHGYRTNAAGIQQMRDLLAPRGVAVLSAPLPYGLGPSACLHLMSLMSMLDEHTVLVDLPWLAVETVELLKARGFKFVEIDYSERDTLACNVLALGLKRLLATEEN